MGLTTKIESIDRDIALLLSDDLSPQGRSAALAAFARAENAKAVAQNTSVSGRVPKVTVAVDGKVGAAEETVRPDGVISYEYDLVWDMLATIGDLLVQNSPARTGRYARSFVLFVDGVEHKPGAPLPANVQEAVFLNTQPYARKIERGLSDQTPDGVFQAVATIASGRYSNVAAIKFTYQSLQESGLVAYIPAARRRGAKGRFVATEKVAARITERATRTPAIRVRLY